MLIRRAVVSDAEAAASVLRRSIRDLCALDHGGDAEALRPWLANKTADTVRSWIEAEDRRVLVAERSGSLLGVGVASNRGEITLNYVAPEARFQGVSTALLLLLEAHLRDLGWTRSRLASTRTAHGFYLARGYEDAGEPPPGEPLSGQPMVKSLARQSHG